MSSIEEPWEKIHSWDQLYAISPIEICRKFRRLTSKYDSLRSFLQENYEMASVRAFGYDLLLWSDIRRRVFYNYSFKTYPEVYQMWVRFDSSQKDLYINRYVELVRDVCNYSYKRRPDVKRYFNE